MMRRGEAITMILGQIRDELVVAANGWISRETCAAHDRAENFYMLGSMGLASSIGLGLALAQPERRVVVFDGDGNLLMALGTWRWLRNEARRTFFTSYLIMKSMARRVASARSLRKSPSTALPWQPVIVMCFALRKPTNSTRLSPTYLRKPAPPSY